MANYIEGNLKADGKKFGIIVARFNSCSSTLSNNVLIMAKAFKTSIAIKLELSANQFAGKLSVPVNRITSILNARNPLEGSVTECPRRRLIILPKTSTPI